MTASSILRPLALLASLAATALPAAATNLTGTFRHPDGSPVNGRLIFLLSQPARLADGSAQVVPRVRIFTVASGQLEAGAFLYGNDALLPSGTHYVVRLVDSGNNLLFEQKWFISGENLDLNTLTPTTIGVALPDPLAKNVPTEQVVEGPVTFAEGLTTYSLTLNGNLLPGLAGAYNLGDPVLPWREAHIQELQTQGHPWYDVRAFGAACDGVTNDHAAIQAAVNAAIAAGGGMVLIPIRSGGQFCELGANTLAVDHPSSGKQKSTIIAGMAPFQDGSDSGARLRCNVDGPCIRFHNSEGTATTHGGGVRDLGVRNIHSNGTAIYIRSTNPTFVIRNVYVAGHKGIDGGDGNTFGTRIENVIFRRGVAATAGSRALTLAGVSYADSVDIVGFETGIAISGVSTQVTNFRLEVNETAVRFGHSGIACTGCTLQNGLFEKNKSDVIIDNGSQFGSIGNIASTNSTNCINVNSGGGSIRIHNYSCGGNHTTRVTEFGEDPDDAIKTASNPVQAGQVLQFDQVRAVGAVGSGKSLWNISATTLSNKRASFCNTNAQETNANVRCLALETLEAPVLQSTVATGTPPLTVASTTLVPSLNAERWANRGAIDFSATLDFASIAAQTCAELTIAATGAAAGSSVAAGWPSSLEAGLAGTMRVSAAGTVSVRLCNVTGAAIDPASATFAGRVVQ